MTHPILDFLEQQKKNTKDSYSSYLRVWVKLLQTDRYQILESKKADKIFGCEIKIVLLKWLLLQGFLEEVCLELNRLCQRVLYFPQIAFSFQTARRHVTERSMLETGGLTF